MCSYSARAARLSSTMGVITVDFSSNQSCEFEDLLPNVAKAAQYIVSRTASHFSVAESPGCKAPKFLLEGPSELLHEVWLRLPADINTRVPLCFCAVEFLWLHPDVTAHQGVVCITVRTAVTACVENILDSSKPDQD